MNKSIFDQLIEKFLVVTTNKSSKMIAESVRHFFINEDDEETYALENDIEDIEDNGSELDRALVGLPTPNTLLYMSGNMPMIYAFITRYAPNCIKVGYTEQGVSKRIDLWREKYEDAEELGRWSAEVVKENIEGEIDQRLYFKDYAVHNTLRKEYGYRQSGYDKELKDEIANKIRELKNQDETIDIHVSSEFFKMLQGNIENEAQQVKEEVLDKIIQNIYDNIKNDIDNNYVLYKFDADGNGSKLLERKWSDLPKTYDMTGIQQECVDNAKDAIADNKTELLMSASPRYGKTHVSYLIIKDNIKDRKNEYVLVTSAKADVRSAWRDDINHIKFVNDFVFIEYMNGNIYVTYKKNNTDATLTTENLGTYDDACKANNIDIVKFYLNQNKIVIVFATLQYLSGKASEEELTENNDEIFDFNSALYEARSASKSSKNIIKFLKSDNPWMMVIDETHYGSHAKKQGATTGLNKKVNSNIEDEGSEYQDEYQQNKEVYDKILNKTIKCTIRMQCSGTPYYILADGEFDNKPNAAIISDVTFSDMIAARDKWLDDNPEAEEQDSPYFGIPNIKKFGMKLTKSCYKSLAEDEVSIKLNNLFAIDSNTNSFIHEDAIIDLMTSIFGSPTNSTIGFLNQKDIVNGRIFKHTMIVLPGLDACVLLEKLLKEKIVDDSREVITLVERKTALSDNGIKLDPRAETPMTLNKALNELDVKGKHSVILTCIRFLTGVSIPLLDSMLFMKDSASPQDYDQAILRLCTRHVVERNGIKVNLKPNVYLIDFNVCRMFNLMKQSAEDMIYAKALNGKQTTVEQMIQKELRAEPIYVEDNIYDGGNSSNVLASMHEVNIDEFMKLYVKYNNQKSIADLVDENIKNNRFKKFCSNTACQNLLKDFRRSLINDGDLKDTYGEDNNIDLPINQENWDFEVDKENNNANKKDKKDKKDPNIDIAKERLKTVISNILYVNICIDKPAGDCKEFVRFIKNGENKEIAAKFDGLNSEIIEAIYNQFSREEKIIIDGQLNNVKLLLTDENMTPIQRTTVAIKKLGRLDDKKGAKETGKKEVALVITPESLVKKMIDKVPEETMKNAESILEVNSKTGEFLVGIYNKYGKSVAEKVKIVAGDDRCKMFIKKVLNLLEISEYNLLNIEDLDGNGKYDVKDFLKLENSEILDMNKDKKKWDVVLMNPPYGAKKFGDEFLHHKFTKKCISISNYVVDIMPYKIVYDTTESQILTDYKKFYDKTLISVEEESSSQFTGTGMQNVAIYVFNNSKKDGNDIMIKDLVGNTKYIKTLNDASYNKIELELFEYIKADNINHNTFKKPNKFVATQENIKMFVTQYCQKLIKKYPNKAFLTANLANGGMNAKFFSPLVGKIFTNINELEQNLIDRKAAYTTILTFDTEYAANNCKCAMCNPVLRYGLYKVQDNQAMNSKCYKYIPNINWEDDRVLTDEGLLEVCGCPKDKAKDYAEYCRKYIEENVDKKK